MDGLADTEARHGPKEPKGMEQCRVGSKPIRIQCTSVTSSLFVAGGAYLPCIRLLGQLVTPSSTPGELTTIWYK